MIIALALVNVLVHHFVVRWDMTNDKRYSISQPTKNLLKSLDQPLEISILLDGELNAGFTRLKKATTEMAEELGIYAGGGYRISDSKQHKLPSSRTH